MECKAHSAQMQVTAELTEMIVKHEALATKHQMIISSYEEHLGSLGTSLKQAKDQGKESLQLIENLESSRAELVRTEARRIMSLGRACKS